MSPRRRRYPQRGSLIPSDEGRLQDLSQALNQLDTRLQRLRRAVENLQQLRQIETRLQERQQAPDAAAEVQQLQQRIDALEASLLDEFVPWQQLGEVFWQAVRFGGVGLVLGWLLGRWGS